jgi:hypothetical protein
MWKTLPRYGTENMAGDLVLGQRIGWKTAGNGESRQNWVKKSKKGGDLRPIFGGSGLKLPLGIADAMETSMTTMTKTATPEVTIGIFALIGAMFAKVSAAIEAEIPIGYEDETGFHTGVKPRDAEAAVLNSW